MSLLTGNDDYGQLSATSSILFFNDDIRRQCFNVTITDDNILFEHNETFTVVARENPPFFIDVSAFIMEPDTVTITIVDQDCKSFHNSSSLETAYTLAGVCLRKLVVFF